MPETRVGQHDRYCELSIVDARDWCEQFDNKIVSAIIEDELSAIEMAASARRVIGRLISEFARAGL